MARFLIAALVLGGISLSPAPQAEAQILWVTGDYRVTEQDRPQQRIGIQLRDAMDPKDTQNWVWLRPDTKVIMRKYIGGGAFRDYEIRYNEAWELLTPGRKFRLNGGRDWDGTITAKKIWM